MTAIVEKEKPTVVTTEKSSTETTETSKAETTEKTKAKNPKESKTQESLKRLWSDPWKYIERFGILLPHLLPSANIKTYARYAGVLVCSFIGRGLNLLIPMQLSNIVNLLEDDPRMSILWKQIVYFMFLKFLNSGTGISLLENNLWRPIESEASIRLNIASYEHVMTLSSDYHDSKQSAAVWEGVRSGWSVISLIKLVSFDVVPRFLDLVIALGILLTKYDRNTASVAAVTMITYNWISIRNQSRSRSRMRKQMDQHGSQANILAETASNWSTVAYFNRFAYEIKRYTDSVLTAQQLSRDFQYTSMFWAMLQQMIMLGGLGMAYFAIAWQIQAGQKRATDFIIFTTYWSQLMNPMSSFIRIFVHVGRTLVEAEKLLEIFETKPSIKDAEDAFDIEISEGKLEFKNVAFGYKPERQILKDVSFRCVPGGTTAIVGETGGGKSTTLRLISRFYDTTSGSVEIDGQDVKKVKLDSLRSLFGIVPQSVGVFNTSILDNLKYAKLDATLEECQEACKAAALHDRIMTFPEQYETVVGEKGVKLSGGELQRLALARVVLKDPKILILDEATSSIDTGTEIVIQESLKKVTKGRTTIVVAHRLSTIAHADLILVMSNGDIVERGTHDLLLAQKGVYHGLWTRQDKKVPEPVRIVKRAVSCPALKAC